MYKNCMIFVLFHVKKMEKFQQKKKPTNGVLFKKLSS